MEDAKFLALVEKFIEVVPFMGLNYSALLFAADQIEALESLYVFGENIQNFLNTLDSYVTRKALSLSDYTIGGISGRIESILWNRVFVYSSFKNYRIFLKKRLLFASNPRNSLSSLQASYRLVDDIWHAVNDTSIGFTFYSRRGTLAVLNASLMVKLANDYSHELNETHSFLRERIKNIVSFSKAKNRARSIFCSYLGRS
ncbi:COQ9 family protein [Neorickettsia helminthoeca str. Oregon]|uniref:COQ9 family protein n=1 Tax=Neorickettsia helminthoeca str. Oregon TaxID=1286528 RepID=X5HKR5_9RICK|nr:COQ9 family protein [Neorickettsia helminthoeca]AHX11654.1 COQ9 family protein [Neorickettsia helminthoeca str. Oregon]